MAKRYQVVEVTNPETVIHETTSKVDALTTCHYHPERGILHRVEGEVRFMQLPATPEFFTDKRPNRRRRAS